MNHDILASRLVEIAGDLAKLAEKNVEAVKISFTEIRALREAQDILAEKTGGKSLQVAGERVTIDKLPGFAPMQLRQLINRIVESRQRATQIRLQFEAVLKEISSLEDEEKSGLAKLKEAAGQVKEKEKFLVEAEKGLLEFTAFVQRKRPGVEQMLADPASSKFGDKAGDFFNRVGAKLGKEVQAAIETLYTQTEEDLTHVADCVSGLKIVERTASVKAATLKQAGLSDVLMSIKDWLAGKSPDSVMARIINFAGDIGRFVRGFAERTGLVKGAAKDLQGALDEAMLDVEQALA